MSLVTLPSRHRIRNSSLGGLRPSTLPHNTEFYEWMEKKHFCFFQSAETGKRALNSCVKGSGANHYPGAPAQCMCIVCHTTTYRTSVCQRMENMTHACAGVRNGFGKICKDGGIRCHMLAYAAIHWHALAYGGAQ